MTNRCQLLSASRRMTLYTVCETGRTITRVRSSAVARYTTAACSWRSTSRPHSGTSITCEACRTPLRRMYTSSSESFAELYPPSPPPPSCFICAAGVRIQTRDVDGQAKRHHRVCAAGSAPRCRKPRMHRFAVTFFTSLVSLLRSSSMMTSESVICCSVGASACTLPPLTPNRAQTRRASVMRRRRQSHTTRGVRVAFVRSAPAA